MVLELKNISKMFGGLAALHEVSFSLTKGEILGLIGPNGAGKTTLFNVITSMFPPTSGQVLFSNEEISGLKPHRITEKALVVHFKTSVYFIK
jgi:branched-chain amino acid transport system ATP-binding protein